MTHTFDDPAAPDFTSRLLPAQRLRITMAPCRVRFIWFGAEKTLTPEQRARAAERFDAAPRALAATKKLLDARHPALRSVTAVRNRIDSFWRTMTLPFPEPSIRLVRLDEVEAFVRGMAAYSGELHDAAADLARDFDELKADAARRLGSLFEPADYPATLDGCFAVRWDFPNLEPPAQLLWLSPSVYQAEEFHVQGRFEEAVQLADRMFLEEFVRSVTHLCERISGSNPDGTSRVVRAAAVNDIGDFIARYCRFNLRSEAQLDELVALVRRTLEGVTPERLREHAGVRRTVGAQLSWVLASLDSMQDDPAKRPIPRGSSPHPAKDT
jgi:hypothetical protein